MNFFGRLLAKWLPKPNTEFGTAGPDTDETLYHKLGTVLGAGVAANTGTFKDGWLSRAKRVDANPGRVGGLIVPECVVVHTTDMPPNDFDPLVRAWNTSAGSKAAAHFIIGRTPAQGLVQMVPIVRNGNHAGGPTKNGKPIHGWWVTKEGRFIHPNLVSVGIEVHSAGALRWKKGAYGVAEYVEDGKVRATFSGNEVFVDELGRPWHYVNQYQLDTLESLLLTLHPALKKSALEPRADAAYIKDRSKWDTSYAVPANNSLLGHVSLDPINKTDPGPQLMTFINAFATREYSDRRAT